MDKTIIIQIGNSDDKLTQKEWSAYVKKIERAIIKHASEVHFSGFSVGDAPWQNAAWVFVPDPEGFTKYLPERLREIRTEYRQDSIAWTEGETQFI